MSIRFQPVQPGFMFQGDDSCAICNDTSLELLVNHDKNGDTHVFHANCINTWVTKMLKDGIAPSCPICSEKIARPMRDRIILELNYMGENALVGSYMGLIEYGVFKAAGRELQIVERVVRVAGSTIEAFGINAESQSELVERVIRVGGSTIEALGVIAAGALVAEATIRLFKEAPAPVRIVGHAATMVALAVLTDSTIFVASAAGILVIGGFLRRRCFT